MKLKSIPQDFQVQELSQAKPDGGPFSLYALHKCSLGTPEAIQAILRSWNLSRQQISYGGLKDRHAETSQFITIRNGPQHDLHDRSFRLEYLGQRSRSYTAQDIVGNRFSIRLRGIGEEVASRLSARLQLIQSVGIINYFDDQRFGSLGHSGQFIAQAWCNGDYERALFLALAEPNSHDRGREQLQKQILRAHWGDWLECKRQLDRSHRRSVVTFLVDHPQNFKRAVALIRSDLRSLYVAAFQSGLWNLWLSRLIERKSAPHVSYIDSAIGPLALPMPDQCDSESMAWLSQLSLPLPSARQHQWPEDLTPELDEILQSYQMSRHEIRLKYPRDTFFSKGSRACWLKPIDFQFSWQDDQLHDNRCSLLLSFELPRGAYATMLVKLLQA